jgi:hypothetical protein
MTASFFSLNEMIFIGFCDFTHIKHKGNEAIVIRLDILSIFRKKI